MTVAQYIHDLLYRHDCVIVPNFGGFIAHPVGAVLHKTDHTFSPPTKQIAFNAHLKHNDGLLVNHIAKCENGSFGKASEKIATAVAGWEKQLQSDPLILEKIGQLTLNDSRQIVFEPATDINYLMSSFGLAAVNVSAIERYHQKVVLIAAAKSSSGVATIAKYAATAAILLTLGFAGWNGYQNKQQQKAAAKEQKELEQKIQNATFVISDPLPTIQLHVSKEVPKPYHIIAGAFQFPENAQKKLLQLKRKGFAKARILGENDWGLTQVAYDSYADKYEAFKQLAAIRTSDSEDAWILIKRLP